ncbi:MAG: hypothetical protein K0S04_3717 [Herbinix sp.]|jgi:membrane protease YdiL (CAAX protease family)|nr:hypothetical protein [Herbinix sp.]
MILTVINIKTIKTMLKNWNLYIPTVVGIIFIIVLYISSKYQWSKGYIPMSELKNSDVLKRFVQDCFVMLPFPLILIIINRKNLSMLGFKRKSIPLCIILFLIYLIFFILHSDYTITGIYRAVFYLIMIGFSEELIMRGYIYLRIKPVNKILAIIVSGAIFGAAHAILPGVTADKSISFILGDMLNYIGFGITGGLIFIACMELSGTILVAILIHGILDYTYGHLGALVLCATLGYLIYINRYRLREHQQLIKNRRRFANDNNKASSL